MTIPQLRHINELYAQANKRLILLDFDGTLAPIYHTPVTYDNHPFHEVINFLSEDPMNDLIIVSGRMQTELDRIFKKRNVILAAEHGGFVKLNDQWAPLFETALQWDPGVLQLLAELTQFYRGSYTQVKNLSLVWNYSKIDSPIEELFIIEKIKKVLPEAMVIYEEVKSFEIRFLHNGKGVFARQWLDKRQGEYQFVLAVGDGATDEDLFKATGKDSITIKVGEGQVTSATFSLRDQADVLPFLIKMSTSTAR